jgi:hypothetical protein
MTGDHVGRLRINEHGCGEIAAVRSGSLRMAILPADWFVGTSDAGLDALDQVVGGQMRISPV